MAKYIRVAKKGLDGDPRAEQIAQVLERASQENYKESLWDSETGLVAGAKREVTKAIDICLEQNCTAEEIIQDIDDILFNLFGETLFEENKGLIYGSKQEVVSEIENLLTPKSEELKAEDESPQDKTVNGITFGIDIDDAAKYPSAVNAVQEAAIDFFTKQNNLTDAHIDYVIAYSDYIEVSGKKLKGKYKIAMAQTELLLEDGGSTGGIRYHLVPLNKAKDLNSPEELHGELLAIVNKHLGDEFLNDYEEEADGIIDGIQKLLDRLT
jgi:hypothetical protein